MRIAKLMGRCRRKHRFILAHDRVDDPHERLRRRLVVSGLRPFRDLIGGVLSPNALSHLAYRFFK